MPKTVLDLGCYDGGSSTAQVKDGDRWILVDSEQYLEYENWGRPKLPDNAEYHKMDLMDYKEPAEIVVCYNVLYHVPDPHAMLKHLRFLTKEKLLLRTYIEPVKGWLDRTDGSAHPHKGTAKTIFYYPSLDALIEELTALGFKKITQLEGSAEKNVILECLLKE